MNPFPYLDRLIAENFFGWTFSQGMMGGTLHYQATLPGGKFMSYAETHSGDTILDRFSTDENAFKKVLVALERRRDMSKYYGKLHEIANPDGPTLIKASYPELDRMSLKDKCTAALRAIGADP